jgi:hypothetical protein
MTLTRHAQLTDASTADHAGSLSSRSERGNGRRAKEELARAALRHNPEVPITVSTSFEALTDE